MLLQTHRALVFQLPTLFRRSRALTATLSPQAVWRTSPCQLQVVRRVRCLPVNCVWCGVDGASGAEARIRLGMTSGSGSAVSLTRRPSSSSRDCVCVRMSAGRLGMLTVAPTRTRPSACGWAGAARTRTRPHAHRLLVCRATSTVETLDESADPSAGLFDLSEKQQAWTVMRRWSVGPPRFAATRAAEGASTTVRPVVEAATAVAEGRSPSEADGVLHPVLELLAQRAVRVPPSPPPPQKKPSPACPVGPLPDGSSKRSKLVVVTGWERVRADKRIAAGPSHGPLQAGAGGTGRRHARCGVSGSAHRSALPWAAPRLRRHVRVVRGRHEPHLLPSSPFHL